MFVISTSSTASATATPSDHSHQTRRVDSLVWMLMAAVVALAAGEPVGAAAIGWTASGKVSSVTGSAFTGGVAANDAVQVELSYDSGVQLNGRSYLPINGALAGRAWFQGPADLKITVRIGDKVWSGEMPEIPAGTNVMELLCWDFGGNPDWFNVTLDAARGGNFPSFSLGETESVRSLILEFRDDTSPADLFQVHMLPDSVSQVCQMTSAKGAVNAGASQILFTIDPATVAVSMPGVPVKIAKAPGGVELEWQSEAGKTYRIEGSADLRCWSDDGIIQGTGGIVRATLNPLATLKRRFYRVAVL